MDLFFSTFAQRSTVIMTASNQKSCQCKLLDITAITKDCLKSAHLGLCVVTVMTVLDRRSRGGVQITAFRGCPAQQVNRISKMWGFFCVREFVIHFNFFARPDVNYTECSVCSPDACEKNAS